MYRDLIKYLENQERVELKLGATADELNVLLFTKDYVTSQLKIEKEEHFKTYLQAMKDNYSNEDDQTFENTYDCTKEGIMYKEFNKYYNA